MPRLALLLLVVATGGVHAAEGSVTPIIPSGTPRSDTPPGAASPPAIAPDTPPPPAPATQAARRSPRDRAPGRALRVGVVVRPGASVTLPGLGRVVNPTAHTLVVRIVAPR